MLNKIQSFQLDLDRRNYAVNQLKNKGIFMLRFILISIVVLITACSNPKDTVIPNSIENLGSIKSDLEKLSPEERQLFSDYFVRHTMATAMGGMFGIKPDPIPEGMTIGKAIEEQSNFIAKEKIRNAEKIALKAKIDTVRKLQQEQIAKTLSFVFLSKKNVEQEYGRKFIALNLAFENKTEKDIAGVKGTLNISDIFGDKILNLKWSNDKGINSKETLVINDQGLDFNQFMDEHMKLWNTDNDKLKADFEVSTILFKDGSKLELTDNQE
jgi:hypothetical protein